MKKIKTNTHFILLMKFQRVGIHKYNTYLSDIFIITTINRIKNVNTLTFELKSHFTRLQYQVDIVFLYDYIEFNVLLNKILLKIR